MALKNMVRKIIASEYNLLNIDEAGADIAPSYMTKGLDDLFDHQVI